MKLLIPILIILIFSCNDHIEKGSLSNQNNHMTEEEPNVILLRTDFSSDIKWDKLLEKLNYV